MTLTFLRRHAAVTAQSEAEAGVKRLGLSVYLRSLYDVPASERLPTETLKVLTEHAEAYDARRAVAEAEAARVGSIFSPLHEYLDRLRKLPDIERESRERAAYAVDAKRRADDAARKVKQQAEAGEHAVQWAKERAEQAERDTAIARELDMISEAFWDAHALEVERSDAHVFDEQGEPYPGASPANLKELADMLRPGLAMSRETLNHWGRVRKWHEARGGQWPAHQHADYRDGRAYLHRNWVITHDRQTIVPPGLKGARLQAWAVQWRDRALGDTEAIVFAVAGEHLTFVTWWDEPTSGVEWAKRLSGGVAWDDGARYEAQNYKAYRVPCPPLYLPSAHAEPTALPTAAERAAVAPAGARLVLGLPVLDDLFRGGAGLPHLTRVLVTGDPQHCKTQYLLEVAEAGVRTGWHVLWVSIDDDPSLIDIRRLQRLGLPAERAKDRLPEDVARLDPHVEVVNDRPLEDAWETAAATAARAGRKLLVLADSIQSDGLCLAAEGKADRAAIEAAVGAVVSCQRRWPATFVATSEVTEKGNPKGSRALEYKFDVRLRLRLSGIELGLTVEKNKPGKPGTVGRRVPVSVDFDRQRLLEPGMAAKAEASAELRARILVAIDACGGVASRSKLETRVEAKSERLRDELTAMVADGVLLHAARGYRRP